LTKKHRTKVQQQQQSDRRKLCKIIEKWPAIPLHRWDISKTDIKNADTTRTDSISIADISR